MEFELKGKYSMPKCVMQAKMALSFVSLSLSLLLNLCLSLLLFLVYFFAPQLQPQPPPTLWLIPNPVHSRLSANLIGKSFW